MTADRARVLLGDADDGGTHAGGGNAASDAASRGSLTQAAQTTRMFLAFFLVGFVVIWLLSLGLVLHLRYNRAAARKGNESAARKIILPAFEPLLITLGVFNALFIVFLSIALATGLYSTYVPPVVLETLYSAHQFDFLAILIFMLQQSVSLPALRRTLVLSLGLSGYTIPYIWYVMTYGDPAKQTVYVTWLHPLRALVLLVSVYVFIWPPNRASTRTLRELAVYNVMRYVLTLVHMVMVMNPATRASSKYVLFTTLLWVALNPLVIWRVLKADTGYWRGMGDRACALQGLFKESHHMHEGVSSQGLHVLIELHRKYVIDFALLEMRQQIGVGTTSTVFRGMLRSRTRVAIKVYHPSNYTEEVIAGFSHEAALCGLLHHPNIVTFYGMCVSPPAICLVFELCQGSLQDVLRIYARRPYEPARQQLLINVGYMLDAARAVAYIHSFSPPFIHRDIKPSNFLVDVACNVKLSDFGESRALGKLTGATAATSQQRRPLGARASNGRDGAIEIKTPRFSKARCSSTTAIDDVYESTSPKPVRDEQGSASSMTVKGTVDYMAPEVINGRGGVACYDQAADVYSLAITMSDILSPSNDRFGGAQSHLHVFESVLNGARPALDPSLPPRLRDVIQCAWASDPRMRPSARAIVTALEAVQETLSAAFVVDVMDELQPSLPQPDDRLSTGASNSASNHNNVSGAVVASVLVEHRFVNSLAEATRMGNAWMDAGLLHHAKHARAFESSESAQYFFDASATMRQALEAPSPSEPASSIPILSRSQHQHQHQHVRSHQHQDRRYFHRLSASSRTSSFSAASTIVRIDACACQQFAQRMVDDSAWRRFRRRAPGPDRPTTGDDMVLTTALLMDSDDDLDAFADRAHSIELASRA